MGFGLDRGSFENGRKVASIELPAILLKVSHPSVLPPPDARSTFSGNVAATSSDESLLPAVWHDTQKLSASSALAPDLLSEQKQYPLFEENKVGLGDLEFELDEVRCDIHAKLTRQVELEKFIASTRTELAEVRRDIDAKLTRQLKLEEAIALTKLFSSPFLMDDEDS